MLRRFGSSQEYYSLPLICPFPLITLSTWRQLCSDDWSTHVVLGECGNCDVYDSHWPCHVGDRDLLEVRRIDEEEAGYFVRLFAPHIIESARRHTAAALTRVHFGAVVTHLAE